MRKLPDDDIVKLLMSSSQKENKEAIEWLTNHNKNKIYSFLKKRKLSEQDADDVFIEALYALWKLAQDGKLKLDTNIGAYLFTICKNKGNTLFTKNQKNASAPIDGIEVSDNKQSVEQIIIKREDQKAFNKIFEKLSPVCQQTLSLCYDDEMSMKEIAKIMEFKNENSAKTQKWKCLQKLKNLLRGKENI